MVAMVTIAVNKIIITLQVRKREHYIYFWTAYFFPHENC